LAGQFLWGRRIDLGKTQKNVGDPAGCTVEETNTAP
jgi:hypothetical protein